MAKKENTSIATGSLKELQDIKRLLVLGLIRSGVSQEHVAKALGVSQSSISRMFPVKIGKLSSSTQAK